MALKKNHERFCLNRYAKNNEFLIITYTLLIIDFNTHTMLLFMCIYMHLSQH